MPPRPNTATLSPSCTLAVLCTAPMPVRHFGHYGVLAEGRAAHVVVQRLAVVAEAAGAVGHHALALGGAHGHAQVGLAALAEQALATLGGVQRNHVVARLDAGHALAHLHHDARAFMAQHHREQAFRIVAGQGERIGVAHTGVGDLHQHFALLRRGDVDLDDLQRLAGTKGDGGTGLLGWLLQRQAVTGCAAQRCAVVYFRYERINALMSRTRSARCSSEAAGWPNSSRRCASITSDIRPLTAPRMAAICCSTGAQSAPASSARSSASHWPRMRRTRASTFFFSSGECGMAGPPQNYTGG
ncbi:hypothetical protein G6F22_012693 [Rhizopus arrhizus]|nr:hypothetical protein G6F22_012693 [Rhizopus arrhizus]